FEARERVIKQLKAEGLLINEEEYRTRVGFSQRTNAVVEPRISTQWFLKMNELAGKALNEVLTGNIKIHPEERFIATYKYWLENVKDWCISRQLWWGQRIPAYYTPEGEYAVGETKEEALSQLKIKNEKLVIDNLYQDDDVLDTWFSSWLWPIEVFQGITKPENNDINYYYPTSVLVTGQDIIFFWVARMIMAGMEYMNKKPFDHVYFTGMVRDKQGKKMSKSLGNSPDLLDLIDKYGADAVRFGIMISAPAGNDLLFDESSCEQGRNFNNKIWNALKLVKMLEERKLEVANKESEESFAVQWFESRLTEVRMHVEQLYQQFKLSEALKSIYSLIWDDFCSWYLEWMKPSASEEISNSDYEKTINFFEQLTQLLHPFMPFITEEIYHQLKDRKEGDDLVIRQFEVPKTVDANILTRGELLKKIITSIREAKARSQLKSQESIKVYLQGNKEEEISELLKKQVFAEDVVYGINPLQPDIVTTVDDLKILIEIKSPDKKITKELQREQLSKDLDYLKGFLASVEKKLSNERFLQNAKPEVVEIERRKKADAEQKIKVIEESLGQLSESR
ncbi:MAG: class I tRNA ligase family protein, partial [Chitinophagaceae bacterium]|nr:class I tRNA ligase family protein [Chitinophagaceae bacterium]